MQGTCRPRKSSSFRIMLRLLWEGTSRVKVPHESVEGHLPERRVLQIVQGNDTSCKRLSLKETGYVLSPQLILTPFTYMHHDIAEVDAKTVFVGTGEGVGADEDDFHTIKRLTVDIDRSEKAEEKAKKKVGVKVGVHSGVVKAFGETPAPKKKVVVF